MAKERPMRVLVYRRTHEGDPDPQEGEFGTVGRDCMGRIRGWDYDAVIGIGGAGRDAERAGIARKITWVGIGAQKMDDPRLRGPSVTFQRFWYKGKGGPLLENYSPKLARHMYEESKCPRVPLLVVESLHFWREVKKILGLAKGAPPSARLTGMHPVNLEEASCKARSKSCHQKSRPRKTERCNCG
jgi:hypothetical protein